MIGAFIFPALLNLSWGTFHPGLLDDDGQRCWKPRQSLFYRDKLVRQLDQQRIPLFFQTGCFKGVGSEYSELLEAAGVDTVPELARRNAANLTQTMSAVNKEKKLTRREPAESEVSKWIEQAKSLPRMLEY